MHDRKRDLLWQTRIITEVYFFVLREAIHSSATYLATTEPVQAQIMPFILSCCQPLMILVIKKGQCQQTQHSPLSYSTTKNTLPWWYVFVIVGHVFCHACTSMTILWQNQDSHTCAIVEVFHDNTKIIIMELFTSMTINDASWKCFVKGNRHVASAITGCR